MQLMGEKIQTASGYPSSLDVSPQQEVCFGVFKFKLITIRMDQAKLSFLSSNNSLVRVKDQVSALVEAQLVEQSLPTSKVCRSIPVNVALNILYKLRKRKKWRSRKEKRSFVNENDPI